MQFYTKRREYIVLHHFLAFFDELFSLIAVEMCTLITCKMAHFPCCKSREFLFKNAKSRGDPNDSACGKTRTLIDNATKARTLIEDFECGGAEGALAGALAGQRHRTYSAHQCAHQGVYQYAQRAQQRVHQYALGQRMGTAVGVGGGSKVCTLTLIFVEKPDQNLCTLALKFQPCALIQDWPENALGTLPGVRF